MALVHIDNCGDVYSSSEIADRFTVSGSSPVVEVAGGRNGSSGIKCSATTEWFERVIPALDTYFSGIAVKVPNLTTPIEVMAFLELATRHVIIKILADGSVQALKDATVLGTSAVGLIVPGSFAYIEAQAVIDDVAGVVVIQLDGTEILNLTSQDTQNGGVGTVDRIRYAGSTDVATYDDLYILDDTGSAPQNTFLGDVRVDASLPTSDGTTTDIADTLPATPTTHFDKVNEPLVDGDSSYVSTSVSGELDLYTFAAVPVVEGVITIFGVQLNMYAKKDNTGGRQLQAVARPVATNYNGDTNVLLSTYQYHTSIWDLDPETAAAWTLVTKDATEFGMRVL